MSDQIPFERAYEIWQDRVVLRHYNSDHPREPSRWRHYTRDEVYEGIKKATGTHLSALNHIVQRLQEHCRPNLLLRKSPFFAGASPQIKVPVASRQLISFEKISSACKEIENRNVRSLPVDEREARFYAIRGLKLKAAGEADKIVARLNREGKVEAHDMLYVFDFAPTSRDARFKEADFLVVLSDEEKWIDLDRPWRLVQNLSFGDAKAKLEALGLEGSWMVGAPVSTLLQVEIVHLESLRDPPYVVVRPINEKLFDFAVSEGIISLGSTLVLDQLFVDFSSKRVEKALRTVGGKPGPVRRRRKRS